MKLSASLEQLKRQAKSLARDQDIPLHEALDRTAKKEGYAQWSLLAAKFAEETPARLLYSRLDPGDMLLIAARPGQGKTLLSLQLAIQAILAGRSAAFFTLEYTEAECRERVAKLGVDLTDLGDHFRFDGSDAICADYILAQPRADFVVIDYLQLLDQRRDTPPLMEQVRALRESAKKEGTVYAFVSQVKRSFNPEVNSLPDLEDVRLPNPLDLHLFDKACFLHAGKTRVRSIA